MIIFLSFWCFILLGAAVGFSVADEVIYILVKLAALLIFGWIFFVVVYNIILHIYGGPDVITIKS